MIVRTEVVKEVEIENAVAEAVHLVFGGVAQAAKALGIVPQGVRNTLAEGRVATRANAERWEEATAKAGCKIPREELIGWATWRGSERHGEGGKARRPKGSSPRRRNLAAVPRAADQPNACLTASARSGRIVRPAKGKRTSPPPRSSACKARSKSPNYLAAA